MIRAATPDDAAAIARVESEGAWDPWSPSTIAGTLALATTRAFVFDDGAVQAHVLASAVADQGEILAITVAPSARRRGLATALLARLDATWAAMGVADAWLEVRADNRGAQALYAALGWTPAGRRKRYYPDGTDALLLRKNPTVPGG